MEGYVVFVVVLVLSGGRAEYDELHCPYFSRVTPAEPTNSPYWADPELRPNSPAPQTLASHLAPPPKSCPPDHTPCSTTHPYRTLSGRCNNPAHHILGASHQPMSRLLPPAYDEALMRTRGADGCLLPNPRQVSLQVRHGPVRLQRHFSTLFMQVGQFVDHDLTHVHTLDAAMQSGECGDCASWQNPICLPIPVPANDTYIPATHADTGRRKCLPVVRSLGTWLPDRTGRNILQHINRNTAFLDLSTVYGSDSCRGRQVRAWTGGLLNETNGLPPLVNGSNFVECRMPGGMCFLTGDDRANEQLGLTVVHTMYLREHNRIASNLSDLNPHWDDERAFQEARRINIAQYQKMVYTEFLPHLIGRRKMRVMGLDLLTEGYFESYDRFTNPSLMEEFVTAAFRVGHAMIPAHLLLLDHAYRPLSALPLVPTFHNPSALLQEGAFEKLLRGMIRARMEGVDMKLSDAILNHLFERPNNSHSGQDLMAINIARSRDHALAPYLDYLNLCEGINATSFSDLKYRLQPAALLTLQATYRDARDVDLIVGALAENSKRRTMVGPTMACIISLQFLYLKKGDRFWFENAAAGFTEAQLASLRRSSLARVVCDSLRGSDARAPMRALQAQSSSNSPRSCGYLPGTDLSLWKEEEGARATARRSCDTQFTFNPLLGWVTQTCT
ncbi:chorion peroxidase-like [Eriocheir sinensis]|uniref:chorion peroxidase-like n=1 Tax=Eriocheir sinensis TaxID=95602 RepID=UPI0021CA3844|nr:chorion peroxidase-like [Eriocheir sinensis]